MTTVFHSLCANYLRKKCICYYCEFIPSIPVVMAFQEEIVQDQMALGAEMVEVWYEDDPRSLDRDISLDATEAFLQ